LDVIIYDCPAKVYTEIKSFNVTVFFMWDSGGIGLSSESTKSLTGIIDFL
jgi:hypothetical protein